MKLDIQQLMREHPLLAGIDEAGRGPLAGPVYAAAVVLDPNTPIEGVGDSKKLSEKKRDALALEIKAKALAWCIASASREEIDDYNILHATMLAMRRAAQALALTPTLILIDGNRVPEDMPVQSRAVVKGDNLVQAIAAASILAKTARDHACLLMHERYPNYGFNQHKGYGTALHLARLNEYGACPEHRQSFAPVRRVMEQAQ